MLISYFSKQHVQGTRFRAYQQHTKPKHLLGIEFHIFPNNMYKVPGTVLPILSLAPPLRAPSLFPAQRNRVIMEEKQRVKEEKVLHHYEHTDTCNFSRWDARECFNYMYARPWERVNQFYSELVSGRSSLSQSFGTLQDSRDIATASDEYKATAGQTEERHGKWARVSFRIVLSYLGNSFDGWQKQPGLNTVQGLIEKSIGRFVDDMKVERLKDKGLPVEGSALVAGRTDKGVTALNQVCSFYTWRKDIEAKEVEDAINNVAPGRIRVVSVTQVSRVFHPNFCAKWRRYLYIFPFCEEEERSENMQVEGDKESLFVSNGEGDWLRKQPKHVLEENAFEFVNSKDELESKNKPTTFSITRVNQLLQQLEGKLLSYKMFARDLKASRNSGPPTECFIYHARAVEARLPCLDHTCTMKVMCVELVANRFLRKMVRVLVATAIREAAAGAADDALVQLLDATCRRATAPPAPPDGLCLVDVGYKDFDPEICLFH